ncbi:hypothetical protein CGC21_23995 [Leishmania donovani]|uniref:Uncharacterized protein n=1 Tax=Leishmania donovani TaxID=5661 RepID=A0A504Y051_LEIDO|nr:hypothetical protein CGC21_23995 [Leishmania donovani]
MLGSPHSTGAYGSAGDGMVAVTSSRLRQRSVVCCAAPTVTVEGATLDKPRAKGKARSRSTVCMDHHILSRMEDDLRRSAMRQENPESAIPDRGHEHDQKVFLAVEAYRAMNHHPVSTGNGLLPAGTAHCTLSGCGRVSNSPSRTPHRSPSRRKEPSLAHQSQQPYPADGRLGPIESACKTPTRKLEEDHCSGAAARSAYKLNKQLFRKLLDLERRGTGG